MERVSHDVNTCGTAPLGKHLLRDAGRSLSVAMPLQRLSVLYSELCGGTELNTPGQATPRCQPFCGLHNPCAKGVSGEATPVRANVAYRSAQDDTTARPKNKPKPARSNTRTSRSGPLPLGARSRCSVHVDSIERYLHNIYDCDSTRTEARYICFGAATGSQHTKVMRS